MTRHIAKMIDHTLLKADATREEIEQLCDEAIAYKFASVCVNPTWVKTAAERLKQSDVEVCTVIGFPLGATTKKVKEFEAKEAVNEGATEVDLVINIAALKDQDDEKVMQDIQAVVKATEHRAIVKVIIETALLTNEEKRRACAIAVRAGAHFVKTSTGFSTGGATVADIQLMREVVGPNIGVKASGGIRSYEDAMKVIDAGASRIGASAGIAIIHGSEGIEDY